MNKASEVLNDIYMILIENHTMRESSVLIDPLVWFYSSGRMTYDEERALKRLDNRQKRIVARKLERGGTSYEVALRVVKYLDKFKAA